MDDVFNYLPSRLTARLMILAARLLGMDAAGAKRIYLFGSYARGDMNEDSDIDLRIDKGAIQGLQLAGLLLDLEDSLGVSVDLIPTTSLDPHFLESIHNDEVLLYEAS